MNLSSLRSVSSCTLAIALTSLLGVSAIAQNNDKSEKAQSDTSNTDTQQTQSNDNSANPQSDSQQSQNDKQSQPQKDSASDKSPQPSQSQNNNSVQQPNTAKKSSTESDTSDEANAQAPPRNDAARSKNQNQTQSDSRSQYSDNPLDRQSKGRADNRNARGNRDFRRDFKFGPSAGRGLTINSVVRDSIFYRSGLRDGDIIVSYQGRPIRSQDDFVRFIVYQPGQRVPVVVLRDGREETIYVVYDQDDVAGEGVPAGPAFFGAEFDPQSKDGAMIIRVQEGSPAHKAGLREGDIVEALNGDRVSSGVDATRIVNSLNAGEQLTIDYTRHARAQAVLGRNPSDNNVDAAVYETNDRRASAAVGVGTDETRRVESDRERKENSSQDRPDNRGGRGGIVPRLRN